MLLKDSQMTVIHGLPRSKQHRQQGEIVPWSGICCTLAAHSASSLASFSSSSFLLDSSSRVLGISCGKKSIVGS